MKKSRFKNIREDPDDLNAHYDNKKNASDNFFDDDDGLNSLPNHTPTSNNSNKSRTLPSISGRRRPGSGPSTGPISREGNLGVQNGHSMAPNTMSSRTNSNNSLTNASLTAANSSALNKKPGAGISARHQNIQKSSDSLNVSNVVSNVSHTPDQRSVSSARSSNNSLDQNSVQNPSTPGPGIIPQTPRNLQNRTPSLSEFARLQAENKQLREKLNHSNSQFIPASNPVQILKANDIAHDEKVTKQVEHIVKSMIFGQKPNLYEFRGLSDKLNLLDYAIKVGDGDVIVKIILFMKRTLNETTFQRYIFQRPTATDHYCNYLRQTKDSGPNNGPNGQNIDELIETLNILNRSEEVAYTQLEKTLTLGKNQNQDMRLESLENLHRYHFAMVNEVKHDSELLQQQINLLQNQIDIKTTDQKFIDTNSSKFKDFEPPTSGCTDLTINETIYYLALYHYHTNSAAKKPINFLNAINFPKNKNFANIFQFCVLHALARNNDIKSINEELDKSSVDQFIDTVEKAVSQNSNSDSTSKNGKNLFSVKNKKDKNSNSNSGPSSWITKLGHHAKNIMKSSRSNLQISPILATMLFRNNKQLREEFCKLIEDVSQKLYIAKMFGDRRLEIDCLAEMGDVREIEKIKKELGTTGSDVILLDHCNKILSKFVKK